MNNTMAINKKTSKTYKFCVLQVIFFLSRFVSCACIISSQIIAESSVILACNFPFSQLHVAGFQT